ncbi:MAG: hypothetical protein EOP67_69365 [Sphingomonas sp.]|nr:MAG: hypothetical protein EOP67_69365 [Sphingomonas sp.]
MSPDVLPLFRELGDLKRIHSADRIGSIAERLFLSGWSGLVAGMAIDEVMERVVGAAPPTGATPAFVGKLAWQPRAGVTCPGRARIVLQPTENHAEHCLMVVVYAVIASPWYGADPSAVFLAAMAHHLHNAEMPDSGYTGEMLLGASLDAVIARARDSALAELPPTLADQVRAALAPIAGDATPEAKAFHVADVLDRVLEIDQHLRTRQVTMAGVLGEYGLVHDGPVKPFHDLILADAGLA